MLPTSTASPPCITRCARVAFPRALAAHVNMSVRSLVGVLFQTRCAHLVDTFFASRSVRSHGAAQAMFGHVAILELLLRAGVTYTTKL